MYGCIYQTADERCTKFSDGKSQSWCVGKDEPCGYRKPSNADSIRQMSDDGIEDWYWWMHKEMMRYTDSRVFVHDWLKSPVEGVDNG